MVSVDTKPFKEDVKTYELRTADIVLVHTKRSLWGWIIRFGTRCYWNHALMVCSTGNTEQGYGSALVVDSKTSGTIVMSRLSRYLNRPDKYDVAVKRLEADWFQDDNHATNVDFRSCVCKTAANEVDSKLGSRLTEQIDQIIRQFTVIFRFIRRKIRKMYTPPSLTWNIRPVQVRAFTCGGFVQWCYYKGVSRIIGERGLDKSKLEEVIFNPRAKKELTPFILLTTTPADLANCEKLLWKYVIKGGVLQEVSNSEDAILMARAV